MKMKRSLSAVLCLCLAGSVCAAPAFAGGKVGDIYSDTTQDLQKQYGDSYAFKVTGLADDDTYTVGNGKVLETFTKWAYSTDLARADGKKMDQTTALYGFRCVGEGETGVYLTHHGKTTRLFKVNVEAGSREKVAKQAAMEDISASLSDPTTQDYEVPWNKATSIAETVPLYDFVGNVNSYLFRTKTNGVEQGFLVMDLRHGKAESECSCPMDQSTVDRMMQHLYKRNITAEDKIVHVGFWSYALPKDGGFINLENGKKLPGTVDELQADYEKGCQELDAAMGPIKD